MVETSCSQNLVLVYLRDKENLPHGREASVPSGTDASHRFSLALDAVKEAASGANITTLYGAAETEAYFRKSFTETHTAKVHGSTARESGVHIASGTEDFRLRILFVLPLPADGINTELIRLLRILRTSGDLLDGCVGAVLVDGEGSLYTKSVAAQLVFAANSAGCAFIGRPLVEATGDLSNFHIIAENLGTSLQDAYLESVRDLVSRLLSPDAVFPGRSSLCGPGKKTPAGPDAKGESLPRLLALHASSRETSNTLALWHALEQRLSGIETREISLRNGELADCSGCAFDLCLHYGEQNSCFYGGVMVEEVYPALRDTDAVMMVCPNYNDALGANLTAFINRLTAMYRAHPFSDKALFAIVVSGYSGSDMIATQLIAALNMNKSFYLPPHFCLMATAHAPGSAMRIPGIGARIEAFAGIIHNVLQ